MSKPGRMLSPAMTRAQKTAAELLYLSSNRSIHYVRAEIGKIFRRDPPSYRSVRDHLRDNGYLRSKSEAAYSFSVRQDVAREAYAGDV